MKKHVLCALMLVLTMAFSSAMALPAGEYEGSASGFGGDVVATVTLNETGIESITVVGDSETAGIGTTALEQVAPMIVATQTVDVDAISGATVTSDAIEAAVLAALEVAGVTADDLVAVELEAVEATDAVIDCDVVVIGAGGAGMTAAIEAYSAGMNVVVLEKTASAGGNTTLSTGGMNAAETSVQAELGIEDSVEIFITDTYEGGYEVGNLELITTMAENSADAIEWLASIDAPLPEVSFSGGATNARIHRPEGGAAVGPYLVEKMVAQIEANGITVMYGTTATEILTEDGAAVGVLAYSDEYNLTINASAVVLATGGFGANAEMCAGYNEALTGFVTTNSPSATGDGIVMAEAIGAALVDIDQIQIHPTVHQETSLMITESVRGGGAIMVNQEGNRFIDELETRDVASAAVIAQEGSYAYLVFDQVQRENLSAIESYVSNGLTVQADTIEELAALIGADAENLAAAVEGWNTAVETGVDEAFGRTTGMDVAILEAPYYAIQISPGIHHTMGGVMIDTETQVIDTEGEVIPGLFAAGEVTGGIHGANRIGGNAVADIVIFGRIAGQQSAAYAAE